MENEKLLGDVLTPGEEHYIRETIDKVADWERDVSDPRAILSRAEADPRRRDKPMAFDLETYKWEGKPAIIDAMIAKKTEEYVKPETKEKYAKQVREKLALDPLTGKIILGGFFDGEKFTYFDDTDERILVSKTLEFINESLLKGYRLISKGGKRFDLPYLLLRAAFYGLKPQFAYSWKDLINKYNSFYHVDLEVTLDGYRLSELGYFLGFLESPENKGSEIAGWYEKEEHSAIRSKNMEDLIATYNIYEAIKWANL